MPEEEFQDLLRVHQPTIVVVGCGGAGGNAVDRLDREGIRDATLVAANTDAQHLAANNADVKLLLGKQTSNGLGAGSHPQIGEQAALEQLDAIRDAVEPAELVFVTAGLGGGTGTGAAPVVAEIARRTGALTIGTVTLPFAAEGSVKRANAEAGFGRLRSIADTVIAVQNDRLLDVGGELPLRHAFKVADEVLVRAIKGITNLVTTPGLVNLDFADIRTVMEDGGVALITFDESDPAATNLVTAALQSPLLDVDLSTATAALVNVTGGPHMTIETAEGVVETLYNRIDPDARIIWGTAIDEDLQERLRLMIIVTGVDSPQISGQADIDPDHSTQQHLDIDIID